MNAKGTPARHHQFDVDSAEVTAAQKQRGFSRRTFLVRSSALSTALPLVALSAGSFGASTLLAGCSTSDRESNSTVKDLYLQALSDAQNFAHSDLPHIADLRSKHATYLGAEIDRLCGTNSHGDRPSHCSSSELSSEVNSPSGTKLTDSQLSDAITTAHRDTAHALAQSGAGINNGLLASISASLSVIAAQSSYGGNKATFFPLTRNSSGSGNSESTQASASATDNSADSSQSLDASQVAKLARTQLASASLSSSAQAAIKKLLTVQYATIYGLGLSLAHASSEAKSSVSAASNKHRDFRDALINCLKHNGPKESDIPLADPGYRYSSTPTDSHSALTFAQDLELNSCAGTYSAIMECSSSSEADAIEALAAFLTQSAVDAAYFASHSDGDPLSDPLFVTPGVKA